MWHAISISWPIALVAFAPVAVLPGDASSCPSERRLRMVACSGWMAVAVGFLAVGSIVWSAEPVELKPGHRQLFLDDHLVERIEGLECPE